MPLKMKNRENNSRSLVAFLNYCLYDIVGNLGVRGDKFGVEIEMEGENVVYSIPGENITPFWTATKDGSLRDNHGEAVEWVFSRPLDFTKSCFAVTQLFDHLYQKQKAIIAPSQRTSVHVHFNMLDKKVYQIYNTYILFTILEDILAQYCGEDRVGNLNCLETRQATHILDLVEHSLVTWQNFNDINDRFRYSAINLASLRKFGTVEFRGMRGLDNAKDVCQWLSILQELTHYTCYKMKNPAELMYAISTETPLGFLKKIFNRDNFKALTTNMSSEDISSSMYEGLRLVQYLANIIGRVADKIVPVEAENWWSEPNKDVLPQKKRPAKVRWGPEPVPGGFYRANIIADEAEEFLHNRERDRDDF